LYAGREARLVHAPVLTGGRDLMSVAASVEQAMRADVPRVAFKLTTSFHVTLARFRRGTRREQVDTAEGMLRGFPEGQRDRIAEARLVASELTSSGPTYTTLGLVTLGSPRAAEESRG